MYKYNFFNKKIFPKLFIVALLFSLSAITMFASDVLSEDATSSSETEAIITEATTTDESIVTEVNIEATTILAINSATIDTINSVITENATTLGLDLTDYNLLTNQGPVRTALVGQNFETIANIKTAFDNAVATEKEAENVITTEEATTTEAMTTGATTTDETITEATTTEATTTDETITEATTTTEEDESVLVIPELSKVRNFTKEVNIDDQASHHCSVEPFTVDISGTSSAQAEIVLNKEGGTDTELEIGSLPQDIDLLFLDNQDYSIAPTTDQNSLTLNIKKYERAQKGSFSVPIIFTKKGDQNSSTICQINIVNL